MTRAEILAGVAAVAHEHLGLEREIGPEERLVEELGLDSIRLLTLAAEVENRFEIALDPEDEAGIATVGDLVATIEAKLAGRGR
jgi:acyl carrier protein